MDHGDREGEYPASAYASNGALWWKLKTAPGSKRAFGAEQKLAAWLFFHYDVGDTFTMRDLRAALGDEVPNDDEHLNRRLRQLRGDGWVIDSYKNSSKLTTNDYRIKEKGWYPGLGPRAKRATISAAARRRVLERDMRRCVICGVGANEPYPGDPRSTAVMTIGHRVPGQRDAGPRSDDELQTECQRCNEPVRDEMPDPPTLAEVLAEMKGLNRAERGELKTWLVGGYRQRSRVDRVYDRVRLLSPEERKQVAVELDR